MPRFVLLRHECPKGFSKPSHWDFMLEHQGALLTWSLEALPVIGGPAVAATKVADHRLAYLEFEGPLSGNRGAVSRVDAGEYRWARRESSCIEVDLAGSQMLGRLAAAKVDDAMWQLALHPIESPASI